MKKILLLAVLICVVSAFAFAAEFTIISVSGKVESAGKALTAGGVLKDDAVIRTNIGASIVLQDADGNEYTIRGNGKIADLVNSSSARVTRSVTRTNTDTVSAARQTSTASVRSSDQAGEDDIAAE